MQGDGRPTAFRDYISQLHAAAGEPDQRIVSLLTGISEPEVSKAINGKRKRPGWRIMKRYAAGYAELILKADPSEEVLASLGLRRGLTNTEATVILRQGMAQAVRLDLDEDWKPGELNSIVEYVAEQVHHIERTAEADRAKQQSLIDRQNASNRDNLEYDTELHDASIIRGRSEQKNKHGDLRQG